MNKFLLLISFIVTIMLGFFAPYRSIAFRYIIDSENLNSLSRNLLFGILICAIVYLLESSFKVIQTKIVSRVTNKLRIDLFSSIFTNSIDKFREMSSSEYLVKLVNNINIISDEIFTCYFDIAIQSVMFIFATFFLYKISKYLLVVVFLVSLLPIIIPRKFSKIMVNYKKDYINQVSKYTSSIKDYLLGFELFKTGNAINSVLTAHRNDSNILCKKKEHSDRTLYLIQSLLSLINNLSFILVIAGSIYFVMKGSITIGMMLATTQMMNFIITPCLSISQNYSRIKSNEQILKDILSDVLDEQHTRKTDQDIIIKDFNNAIEYKGLSLYYDSKCILKDINLKIEKGKKYIIVGGSGSGKTTLLKSLIGYFKDYSGSLTIDGQEVKNIKAENLYDIFSIVSQDVFLFNDTLLNNITLFDDYNPELINSAIKNARLDEFVEKNGIEYKINSEDSNISGGEKRRVGLARALVRETPVVLLDEFDNGLDNLIANQLYETIFNLQGSTLIAISHRLKKEWLQKFDEIIVMNEGGVVEKGDFNSLVTRNGFFSHLYNLKGSGGKYGKESELVYNK